MTEDIASPEGVSSQANNAAAKAIWQLGADRMEQRKADILERVIEAPLAMYRAIGGKAP